MGRERIEEVEMWCGAHKKKVVTARKPFCQLALWEMGLPGAEVVRNLGVKTFSVNRLAVSEEAADLKKYLKMLQSLRRVPSKLFK